MDDFFDDFSDDFDEDGDSFDDAFDDDWSSEDSLDDEDSNEDEPAGDDQCDDEFTMKDAIFLGGAMGFAYEEGMEEAERRKLEKKMNDDKDQRNNHS